MTTLRKPMWTTLPKTLEQAWHTRVFTGGACNIRGEDGSLKRNEERDDINTWLCSLGITIFDPQIHPETHDREYDPSIDVDMEMAARAAAEVALMEVSPGTFGGVTSLEIFVDHRKNQRKMVVYFSDANPETDALPPYDQATGHPLFVPAGISHSEAARAAHYNEMIKNSNAMRRYVLTFAKQMENLVVQFGGTANFGDVVITSKAMHAIDLFKVVAGAAAGDVVVVRFVAEDNGEVLMDGKGNPIVSFPAQPSDEERQYALGHYVNQGCELRKVIARDLDISVHTRVVYTQQAAKQALSELLKI